MGFYPAMALLCLALGFGLVAGYCAQVRPWYGLAKASTAALCELESELDQRQNGGDGEDYAALLSVVIALRVALTKAQKRRRFLRQYLRTTTA